MDCIDIAHCDPNSMSKTMVAPPPPPQWVVDLNNPLAPKPKTANIPDPPGFTAAVSGNKVSLILSMLRIMAFEWLSLTAM